MTLARDVFRHVRRPFGRAIGAVVEGAGAVVSAMPTRGSLRCFDAMAWLFYWVDARGRRAGRQNLRLVFGDTLPGAERRRILRGSYRTLMRGVWALLHGRRLTPERYARLVVVEPEDEAFLRRAAAEVGSGIMVSGHFGNWELLLASRTAIPWSPRFAYMSEQTPFPEVDEALDRLRDRGGGSGALRKGGSLALKAALDRRECVGILVDRNVRRRQGGVYVPFLGLPARTTPLPVLLARRYGRPLSLTLCLPLPGDRWRLWASPDLMEPPTPDEAADVRRTLARVNDLLGQKIREQPEAWLWMIKRWKSRPTQELGRYPRYSYVDPDR